MVLDMSISSCAILVCSDRCFNGESEDRSGKALEKIVREELDCQNTILKIVPGTSPRFWVLVCDGDSDVGDIVMLVTL